MSLFGNMTNGAGIVQSDRPPANKNSQWIDNSSGSPVIKVYDKNSGEWVEPNNNEVMIGKTEPDDTDKIWLDTSSNPYVFKIYDNHLWNTIGGGSGGTTIVQKDSIAIDDIEPEDTTLLWLDTSKDPYLLKVYVDREWKVVGEDSSKDDTEAPVPSASKAPSWIPHNYYLKDEIVVHDGVLYRALNDHISAEEFIFDVSTIGRKWESLTPSSEGDISQVTKLGVIATKTSPRIINITIPRTTDFKRRPLEVLKFKAGNQDIIETKTFFNNSDSSDFDTDDTIEFDGVMKLKTNYIKPMETLKSVHRITLNINDFKEVNNIHSVEGGA